MIEYIKWILMWALVVLAYFGLGLMILIGIASS